MPNSEASGPHDYHCCRTTYYLPDGATADFSFERPQHVIGDAVRAAILGAQQGRVMCPEFKKLSQRAGCVGYMVWISGRHVAYLGHRGETHIESPRVRGGSTLRGLSHEEDKQVHA